MNEHDHHDETVIDLGDVSTVTRGQAIVSLDSSTGQQRFSLGMIED